jgi:hypothetical protein
MFLSCFDCFMYIVIFLYIYYLDLGIENRFELPTRLIIVHFATFLQEIIIKFNLSHSFSKKKLLQSLQYT